jgi:hypothetical protein
MTAGAAAEEYSLLIVCPCAKAGKSAPVLVLLLLPPLLPASPTASAPVQVVKRNQRMEDAGTAAGVMAVVVSASAKAKASRAG